MNFPVHFCWRLAKSALLSVFFLLLAASRSAADEGIPDLSQPACVGSTRTVGGRVYCLHVPASASPGKPLPLVILLHGYGSNGQAEATYFRLDAEAEKRGFLLAKPDGTKGRQARYWNAFPACCATPTGAVDDVGFLMALVRDISAAYPVDPNRISLMGHSNGAFMAYRMACDHAETFSAVVGLAGAVDPGLCHPSRPVSIAIVQGTKDRLISVEGGKTISGHPYGPLAQTVDFWVHADRCTRPMLPVSRDDLVSNSPFRLRAVRGAETEISRATDCGEGSTVELWKMEGAGHIPLWNEDRWPAAPLDFLFAHPRAVTGKP